MDKILEPWVKCKVRGFTGKIKVQFTAVVARDARRCFQSGTQLRTKEYTFTLKQHRSFLTQPNGSEKVTMPREGNRDTHKVVCMLKARDAQSVTSLMLKRELENARRELPKIKNGQHENKRENTTGEITMDEKIARWRTGHATCDPRCECLKVRVNTSTRFRTYFDYATIKNSQQSTRCRSQDLCRCWTARRNVCESRASQKSKLRRS